MADAKKNRPRKYREMPWTEGVPMTIQPVVREDSPWDSNNDDEPLWWPRVAWIDPGTVSGVAVAWFDPQAIVAGKPLPRCILAIASGYMYGPELNQAANFVSLVAALDKTVGLAFGSESFILGNSSMSQDLLSPVRLRSMIEFHFWARRRHLWSQSPSDAKTNITDARLQLWNLYVAGPDHQRDARRHCLLWIKRLRTTDRESFARLHGNETEWWSGDVDSS